MPIQADTHRTKTVTMGDKENEGRANQRWWKVEEDKIYKSVFAVCDGILLNLSVRRRMNWFFANMYNDTGSAGMAGSKFSNLYYNKTAMDGNAMLNGSLTLNASQSAIDTACAMISKNKPKPQFLTDGEQDYSVKQRGKKLTKYVEGVFDKTKMYKLMQGVFLDACIFGTGAIKLYTQDNEVKAEKLFIEELLVDDIEGMHECPTQIHQRKYIARDILLEMFKDDKDKQEKISTALEVSGGSATFSTADVIPVIESWHLKSGKKAKDGLHTICIENCTLLSETYSKDYYPIVFFRWAEQTLGFWGRGILHEVWKLQRELDILLQTIQAVYRRLSGPVVAVESGSNISEAHLTSNKLAKIIEYTVQEPKYLTPPMMQPEMYSQVQYLEDRIYKISGVSQAQATGEKPDEVKSAIAIRETNDLAAGRFELAAQNFESTFLTIADIVVDLSADLDNPSILTLDRTGASSLNFKDAMVDRAEYKLQLFPISGLPSTPAGRLDQLMDYAQAGYLTKEQVMDIADFPDLEDTVTLETASLHLTQQILSNIKEKGQEGYLPPGPYMDLQMAYRMSALEIDRATLQKVPEDHIELLRQFNTACKTLQQQSLPAAQAQPNAGTASQNTANTNMAQPGAQSAAMPGELPSNTPPTQTPGQ